MLKKLFGGLLGKVGDVFSKREDRKLATVSARAKLDQIRVSGAQNIELSDAEWEALSLATQKDSWKDEYLTFIITSPIVGLLGGSVYAAFTGDTSIVDGFNNGIALLNQMEGPLMDLMYPVVLAGVGLKMWRSR